MVNKVHIQIWISLHLYSTLQCHITIPTWVYSCKPDLLRYPLLLLLCREGYVWQCRVLYSCNEIILVCLLCLPLPSLHVISLLVAITNETENYRHKTTNNQNLTMCLEDLANLFPIAVRLSLLLSSLIVIVKGQFFCRADAVQRGFQLHLRLLQAVQNCFIVASTALVIVELHTCILPAWKSSCDKLSISICNSMACSAIWD